MKHALIIYSGGLDTTVCIPLMREQGFEKISTVTIDVGQPDEDNAVAEMLQATAGDLQRQPGLADPTRASDGHQPPAWVGHEVEQRAGVVLPPEE